MLDPLTTREDVEAALLRPLTANEATYIETLIDQASALLRQAAPSVDARIQRYIADPTDPAGLDIQSVVAVLAGVIKRYLVNPTGIATTTNTVGPYSQSVAYALRVEKDIRGALQITKDDLDTLFPIRTRLRARSFRINPALAPRPVGRYGGIPTVGEAVDATITYTPDPFVDPALLP